MINQLTINIFRTSERSILVIYALRELHLLNYNKIEKYEFENLKNLN